ncbi:MAG TPA: AAA family ATPase, partial [Thermoanaerobaculia bacterium]|nr:AAA family ATPase [Thermoanaerobaculia bacterium]
ILDFGIAKLAGATTLTRAGSLLGTPAYMSPEQAFDDEVDARTDLWSLGAVIYEMAAGRRPFRGEREQAVLYSLLHADPEPLARLRPEAPPELERIVGRLLMKDPAQRYQSAAEVIDDLQALARSALGDRPRHPRHGSSLVEAAGGVRGGPLPEAIGILQDPRAEAPTEAPPLPWMIAERRQLTVLCCELLPAGREGSSLDAEDLAEVLHEVMPDIDRACSQAIARFSGHIARRLAAGLLVYFGYPVAHEDDSRRAVYAALEMRAAIRALSGRCQQERGVRLELRAGIHTGLVVSAVQDAGAHEQLAQGVPPAVAEQLLGLAEADAVVVSEATRRLIEGFFATEKLGPVRLPGTRHEQSAYRVVRESGAETRFHVELRKGLTPLVGRSQEIALVLERWAAAKEGRGQVVMLAAEAGIGKSRLLEEIRRRIGRESHHWIEGRCSPYHQNSAFYPLIAMLAAWLGLDSGGSQEENLSRLESRVAGLESARGQIPLLASLLSISCEVRHAPLDLEPRERRQRTLEAVAGMVLEDSVHQPVALVIEDLHWADPSTLDWLGLVLEQATAHRILALLAFRPDFTPPPSWRTDASRIQLGRLHQEQTAEMIGKITGGQDLPPEVAEEIHRKTEGVPLFIEDLTRMVIESGLVEQRGGAYALAGPFRPLAIPDTLQEALMARLDRLETARPVAQLAAIIGREFLYEMLREVAALDERTLGRELDRLVAAGLLHRRGLPPRATYVFKHALIQEALVHSLLKRQRREYHGRIAEALIRSFPEIAASQPEMVAQHWTEAGQSARAADHWLQAAQRALEVSANVEALRHATQGLELLAELPESIERNGRELLLQSVRGGALLALEGWASPEYRACSDRALALCLQVGDSPTMFAVRVRLSQNLLVKARLGEARELGGELLKIAEAERDEDFELEARGALCVALAFLGDPAAAREQAERGLAIYDLDKHHARHALIYGQDPMAIFMASATGLWQLGYPDQSLELSRKALRLAGAFSHAFSRCFLLCGAAWNLLQVRDAAGARTSADQVIEIAQAHGLGNFLAWGTTLRGAAIAAQGESEEGIAAMASGRAAWHAAGAQINASFFPCLLAEACLGAGRRDEAIGWVDLALAGVPGGEERYFWSEVHRLKGDLLRLGGSPAAEAETWFEQSRQIARQQQARSLELRAATSLARLHRDRGERERGRRLLSEIYVTFREGFDTPDLLTARGLLAELS